MRRPRALAIDGAIPAAPARDDQDDRYAPLPADGCVGAPHLMLGDRRLELESVSVAPRSTGRIDVTTYSDREQRFVPGLQALPEVECELKISDLNDVNGLNHAYLGGTFAPTLSFVLPMDGQVMRIPLRVSRLSVEHHVLGPVTVRLRAVAEELEWDDGAAAPAGEVAAWLRRAIRL